MLTKGLFGICAAAVLAMVMAAQPSRADSLDEAVTAGGMGAQLDGFRAFLLPGVMPASLVTLENHRKNAQSDLALSTDEAVDVVDDWADPASSRSRNDN